MAPVLHFHPSRIVLSSLFLVGIFCLPRSVVNAQTDGSSDAVAIGRWAGAVETCSGDFVATEVDLLSDGNLKLTLPQFDCTDFAIQDEEAVFETGFVQFNFRFTNSENCRNVLSKITLSHVAGSEWTYSSSGGCTLSSIRYQCLSECDNGFYCNSHLEPGKLLGECLPIGNWLPVGDFTGEVRFGDSEHGVIDSDPIRYTLSLLPDGSFISRIGNGGNTCFNQEPRPAHLLEPGRIEVLNRYDNEGCGNFNTARLILIHIEGDQWEWEQPEYAGGIGQGMLTFHCSLSDCGADQACSSRFADDGSINRECMDLGSVIAGNTFRNNNRLSCPFGELGPVDNPDLRLQLNVSQDLFTREILTTGSQFETEDIDDTPETFELQGQEVFWKVPGCHPEMAAQQIGNSVCFSYEYESLNLSGEFTSECRVTCVGIGSSESFEIESSSTTTCGFTLCVNTFVRFFCRITVENQGDGSGRFLRGP